MSFTPVTTKASHFVQGAVEPEIQLTCVGTAEMDDSVTIVVALVLAVLGIAAECDEKIKRSRFISLHVQFK